MYYLLSTLRSLFLIDVKIEALVKTVCLDAYLGRKARLSLQNFKILSKGLMKLRLLINRAKRDFYIRDVKIAA